MSDRVSVILLKMTECEEYVVQQEQLLMIINVFAPTASKTKDVPTTLCEMYAQMENIVTEVKKQESVFGCFSVAILTQK